MAKKPTPASKQNPKTKTESIEPSNRKGIGAIWVLLAVLAFTAFLYGPSLHNGFTNRDDDVYVTAN